MDLSNYFNGLHTDYLQDFFKTEEVTLLNIPFKVKLTGLNTLETAVDGPYTVSIGLDNRGVDTIYFLGYGTYLAKEFGHQDLFCSDMNHFSILTKYSDGSFQEDFPTDLATGEKEWSDILRSEGKVIEFPAKPVAYLHVYSVPVDPYRRMTEILINDKFEGKAQYVVFAISLSIGLVVETVTQTPSRPPDLFPAIGVLLVVALLLVPLAYVLGRRTREPARDETKIY